MRGPRGIRRLLLLIAAAALVAGGIATSGATFVAGTSHTETFSSGDWAAPDVTIDAPADGALLNTRTPAITGTAGTAAGDGATVTVRLYAGSSATGTPVQSITVARGAGGAFSATPASLPDGLYTARAEQSDAAGNTGRSTPVSFTVDATAPAVTITQPAAGARTDATPDLAGTAGAGARDAATVTVRLYAGTSATGTPVRTLSAPRTGTTWAVEALPALASGTYTARAEQADDAGNRGLSAARTFTVDAVAPTVTISAPAAGARLGTQTPTISGRAGNGTGDEATVTVRIWSGTSTAGAPDRTLTTTRGGRNWSLTVAPALADGTYTVRAEQRDDVGNTGLSAARTFIVDTAAPALTVTSPVAGATVAPGAAVAGTAGTAAGDSATVTVRIYGGTAATGTPARTLTATRNATTGAWSVATSPALPTGTYTLTATQADGAGNTRLAGPVTYAVDATPPAPDITAPAAGATVGGSATLSGGAGAAVSDATTVTLRIYSGTTTAGALVRQLTAPTSGPGWSITVTPALATGTYTATISQSDAAGNTGTSAPVTFTVDATAPAGLSITAPTANAWLATGRPAFAGAAGNAAGDQATVRLLLYTGASATGSPARTLTTARTAAAWTLTPAAADALADGQWTAVLEQSDGAGNTGRSAAVTFRVDTTAPAIAVSSPAAGQRVGARPVIAGTAGVATGDAASVAVRLYAGASATGTPAQTLTATRSTTTGAFSIAPATLAEGTWTVQAAQADSAGNTGASAPVTFVVDATAPTAASIAAANGGGTAGRPDAGDAITFTWSEAMRPASLLAGWDGSSRAVRVRFFSSGGGDGFTILDDAGAASVRIDGGSATRAGVSTSTDVVSGTVTFAATMALSPGGTAVTVTLGAPDTPAAVRAGPAPARNMTWSANTAATDLAGNAVARGNRSESDGDVDF